MNKNILYVSLIVIFSINICFSDNCTNNIRSTYNNKNADLIECKIVEDLLGKGSSSIFLLYNFKKEQNDDAGITVKIFEYDKKKQIGKKILFSMSGLGLKVLDFDYLGTKTNLLIEDINGDGETDWAIRTANFKVSALMIFTYNKNSEQLISVGGSYYYGLDEKIRYKKSFTVDLEGSVSIENNQIIITNQVSKSIYELNPNHQYTLKSDKRR